MAKECNGCHVQLDRVPLKYPGMAPWEIWISESQERMTLAIPKEKLREFMDLVQRREVEATVIGTFTDSGRCVVEYHGEIVMDVDLDFLHEGLPKKHLKTTYSQKNFPEPLITCPQRLDQSLLSMIQRKNICSTEYISTQYDHTVQGGHVLGPVQGKGRVQAGTTLTKVVLESPKGVGLSQGIFPSYSEIDPYHMAGAAIDTAIRGLIGIGISLDNIALLDNFCWCSSDDQERLGQLKLAAKGCYDFATVFGTPFISGKDSMFNDFSGFDAASAPVRISVPPTLLISSIGIHDNVAKAVSIDAKFKGDFVYVIGETAAEMGGSEYFSFLGSTGNVVPKLAPEDVISRYQKLTAAISDDLVASAYPVSHGGLAVALAKVAIAGRIGMEITIPNALRQDYFLFSESLGRFVVTVSPANRKRFEEIMRGEVTLLGEVCGRSLRITGQHVIIDLQVDELETAFKSPFAGY
jgi:phosphoribosylformylglycinamidine synthase